MCSVVLVGVSLFSVFSAALFYTDTMFHLADGRRMSSTLVETVSINYEDFNESFLTCGTCLCMYDGQEHSPKLLHCSHTVCRSCLQRIVEAQPRENGTFRCPICRETITLPRGGVVCFPPSFIVNQLLDLMQRQRRDVIPKCSMHTNQELLFCETCDSVFCTQCTGGQHNGAGISQHTVIPFSIAIKRMSEILLYKAELCMRNLNKACDIVNEEIQKLDQNAEECLETINAAFSDITTMLETRRREVMQMVKQTHDDKKKVLQEQLQIIEAEKTKVQTDCEGLQQQVEVRNITKRISDLNEKLDMSTTLSEPRENAFMKFEYKHNHALQDFINTLNALGRIKISTTFPALCIATYGKVVTHLRSMVSVTTVDYHGNSRTNGGDPVVAELRNEKGEYISCTVRDHDNGHYDVVFFPSASGKHSMHIRIFDRPIKGSPFIIDVTDHNNPVKKLGGRGSGNLEFTQPVSVAIEKDAGVFVLDTGNSRIKVIDKDCSFVRHMGSAGLESHSGTGVSLTPTKNLVVVNWRTKYVTELTLQGEVVRKFTSPEFNEPINVAVNSHKEIIVADNGAGKLFVFNSTGRMINKIGGKGDKPGMFKLISSIAIGQKDEIIVADHRLQVFTKEGKYVQEIHSASNVRGQYGGVCVDQQGNILATRSEKGRSFVQVFNRDTKWRFNIDSFDDKLKRPSGLATREGFVYVVDLGNDCVKKFPYQ